MTSALWPRHRIKVTRNTVTPELVGQELAKYETKYGLPSTEFLRRYMTGEMHEPDMVAWEFFCDLARETGVELS